MHSHALPNLIVKREFKQAHTVMNICLLMVLDKPYENEVTLRGQKICLKCYQLLKLIIYFGKGFRSFHKGNVGCG